MMQRMSISPRAEALLRVARQLFASGTAVAGIAVILISASPAGAQSLTPAQKRHYAYQGIYYIGGACTTSTSDDATVVGSINGSPDAKALHSKYHQHVIDAFFFFLSQGFTPAQAAGLVGNFMKESGETLDPTITNSIGAHGIAQWLGGRRTNMAAWVSANFGGNPDSFVGQLNFVVQELKTSYSTVLNRIKGMSTPQDVANYINDHYEISGDHTSDRADNARDVFDAATKDAPQGEGWIKAAGGSVVTNPATGGGCVSNVGPVDCTSATGTPKILCEAKKYNGNYYLWGGGHEGYDSFKSGCPVGNIAAAVKASTSGNPGPCATDCSGLVSIAVDDAFGLKEIWTVGSLTADSQWQRVDVTAAQPGDVVTAGTAHVEVVDHYDSQLKVVHTFGSHETGTRTSASSAPLGYYDQAWHWGGKT